MDQVVEPRKGIGLVAHDNKKIDLIEWATFPVACNRASADLMVSSPLMWSDYERQVPDYQTYLDRQMPSPLGCA